MYFSFPLIFQYIALIVGGILSIKLFVLLRIPTPALLGTLSFYSLMNIYGYLPPLPTFWISIIGQFILGMQLSTRFTRNSLKLFLKIPFTVTIITSITFIIAIIFAYLFHVLSGEDFKSVFIATAPGGFAEMIALGQSLDANTVLITFIQTLRLIAILVLTPLLLKLFNRGESSAYTPKNDSFSAEQLLAKPEVLLLFAINISLCWLYYTIRVPAAIILATITGSTVYFLLRDKSINFPKNFQYFGHTCIALATAKLITLEAILAFDQLLFLILTILVASIILSFLLGNILAYFTAWDKATCQLACSTGGLSQMALTAQDMNANVPLVIFFHLIRIIGLITLWPLIIRVYFS